MEEEMNPEHTKGTRAVRILFSKVFYLRPDQNAKDCAKSFLSTMGFEYVSHEEQSAPEPPVVKATITAAPPDPIEWFPGRTERT
jgi:hypothetical protein